MTSYALKPVRQLAHAYAADAIAATGLPANHYEEAVARLAILRVEAILRYDDRCPASLTDEELRQAVADAVDAVGMWL